MFKPNLYTGVLVSAQMYSQRCKTSRSPCDITWRYDNTKDPSSTSKADTFIRFTPLKSLPALGIPADVSSVFFYYKTSAKSLRAGFFHPTPPWLCVPLTMNFTISGILSNFATICRILTEGLNNSNRETKKRTRTSVDID